MRTIASASALLLGLLAAGCTGELVGGGQRPAEVLVVSGDLQTGTVGQELAQPLVVQVVDDAGKPVRDQLVNFRVTRGGGSVFAGSAITNRDGIAQERWTLGTVADTQQVEARAVDPATGERLVFATFRALATPDAPAAIVAVGASTFTGLPSLPLADSVAVFVRDVYGNPVPGQTVAWSVPQGGGSVSPATSVTGANGVARAQWTLGPQFEGTQVLSAAVGVALSTQFTANVLLPSDAVLVRVSGNAQTGTVGQALAQPLVARVQRADGTGIAGIPVTFTVPTLFGAVSPAMAVSDADGRVSVVWTLGTFAGGLQAEASIPTGSTVSFTATSRPGAAAALQKVSGDAQQGRAGATLADSLAVRAVDTYGNVVPGVTVTWSAGSGSASPASTTTRADGTARTSYTLPAAGGTVTIHAAAAGATGADFTATSVATPVYMRILQPAPDAVVGDNVTVTVAVDSATASVASIEASAAGRTVTLAPFEPGRVRGTLSLAGTPMGVTELRVVATTVNGDTSVITRSIIHDAPPRLAITAPARNVVARPQVRIDADCVDDAAEGCTSIEARAFFSGGLGGGTVVATGTTGIHTTVSLAAFDGNPVILRLTGRDARGQSVINMDTVWVESSTALTELASAGVRVWDVDLGRVLYADSAGALRMRSGSQETLLASSGFGYLHSQGAVYLAGDRVWDWRGGATAVDAGPWNGHFNIEGDWAQWSNSREVYRRDLAAGSTTLITTTGVNSYTDVAADGTVAFWEGVPPITGGAGDYFDVYRYNSSGITRLTADADNVAWNIWPVTDGTNFVYLKNQPNNAGFGRIALWRDGTETLLTTTARGVGGQHRDYEAAGGWIAWTDADGAGILQIWTRSPDGVTRRVTSSSISVQIRGLGPDGTVAWTAGGPNFVSRPPYTGTPLRATIGSCCGTLRFKGNDLLYFLGRSAFRVNY